MIYDLDEVERPDDRIIEDDDKCDEWYRFYKGEMLKKLKDYHKSMKTSHVDRGVTRTSRSIVHAAKNDKTKG